jgi:hypothetical protein
MTAALAKNHTGSRDAMDGHRLDSQSKPNASPANRGATRVVVQVAANHAGVSRSVSRRHEHRHASDQHSATNLASRTGTECQQYRHQHVDDEERNQV